MTTMEATTTERTLEELAGTANREHAGAERAAREWMERAVAAGSALLDAKKRVPYGEWWDWIEENCEFSTGCAAKYIRVAVYEDEARGSSDLTEAGIVRHLKGLPPVPNKNSDGNPKIAAARRLVNEEGMTQTEAAKVLGVDHASVWTYLDDRRIAKSRQRSRDYRRKRAAARRALEEKEKRQNRDRAAKRAGGAVAHAYSNLRKCLSDLQAAIDDAEDRSRAAQLREAMSLCHKAEDEIVGALGVEA